MPRGLKIVWHTGPIVLKIAMISESREESKLVLQHQQHIASVAVPVVLAALVVLVALTVLTVLVTLEVLVALMVLAVPAAALSRRVAL